MKAVGVYIRGAGLVLVCNSFMNERADSNLLVLGRDGNVEVVIFNRIFIKYPFG